MVFNCAFFAHLIFISIYFYFSNVILNARNVSKKGDGGEGMSLVALIVTTISVFVITGG